MNTIKTFKRLSLILLVFVLCMQFCTPAAFADNDNKAVFSWTTSSSTTEYKISPDGAGKSNDFAWSCDSEGNFTITFTASGTLTLTSGSVSECNVSVIGGGAGGSAAWGSWGPRYGAVHAGNGGGAGAIVEQAVSIAPSVEIPVVVGAGGSGGIPYPSGTNGSDYFYHWDYAIYQNAVSANRSRGFDERAGYAGREGYAGEQSQFGTVTAAGGQPNAGGAGGGRLGWEYTNTYHEPQLDQNGKPGSERSGGGGAALMSFYETAVGNYNTSSYSCFVCAADYCPAGAHLSNYNPREVYTASKTYPGTALNGGGHGGYPICDHEPNYTQVCIGIAGAKIFGADGVANTGGGGGGGGIVSGKYGLGIKPCSSKGSAEPAGFAGNGGNGGSGLVVLTGTLGGGVGTDYCAPGAGAGLYGGTVSIEEGIAGGGSGYVGESSVVVSGTTNAGNASNPAVPDSGNDGYGRITLIRP